MHRRIRRWTRCIIWCVAGLLVVSAAFFCVFWLFIAPGMPGYPATDHDWALTQIARTATPIRQALERFHHDHSIYPADEAALAPYVSPNSISKEIGGVDAWSYERHTQDPGYSLIRSLGWDPLLVYDFDGSSSHWTLEPGDGRPDRPVILDP